jgi:hypothetical protein
MENEVSDSGCESFPMSLYDYIIYIDLTSNFMLTGDNLRNIIVIAHNRGHAWRRRFLYCPIFCHSTDVMYHGCWYVQTPLRKERYLKG